MHDKVNTSRASKHAKGCASSSVFLPRTSIHSGKDLVERVQLLLLEPNFFQPLHQVLIGFVGVAERALPVCRRGDQAA